MGHIWPIREGCEYGRSKGCRTGRWIDGKFCRVRGPNHGLETWAWPEDGPVGLRCGGGEGTNERRGVGHGLGKPDVHDEWEKGRGTGEGARPRTPGT